MLVKNRNYDQKLKFWSKIEILVKIEFIVKNRDLGGKNIENLIKPQICDF